MSRELRVLVIGAGLAGLSAAHALRRRAEGVGVALSLAVVGRDEHPGGMLRSIREADYLIEWGANAFRTGVGATADLVARLGLAGEIVPAERAASQRFIYQAGRLHRLPGTPWSLLGFQPLSRPGRWRVLAEPFAARRVDREESVHDYATRHLGEEAAAVLLGTLVRGVYGGDARKLSVDAAFPVMREMERDHRSLVVAAVAGARKRRRERKRTWSFRLGMGQLLERMAENLAPELELGVEVERLTRTGTGYRAQAGTRVWDADAVVLAIPPHAAAALLADFSPIAAESLNSIEAADIAVTALAFPREAFVRPPQGYGFLVAPGEPHSVLGVLYESNIFPGRAPAGQVLLRAIQGGVADPHILERDDATLLRNAHDLVDRALGLRGQATRSWLWRARKAIPQYHLGHRERIAVIETELRAHPGIELAGSAYRGVAVGNLVEDAERLAERVLAVAHRRRTVGVAA
jgi:oxygen-dependent protoporphyrinogen oxidase